MAEVQDEASGANRRWRMRRLSEAPDDVATDTAEIRWVFKTATASVVHCTLAARATSVATRNLGIDEIWYFIGGHGEIWLSEEDEEAGTKEPVGPGTCLMIPAGVHFQYRSLGEQPLTFLCVTMPPFEANEANIVEVEAHWPTS